MQIIDKRDDNLARFEWIQPGDVFEYADDFYMAINMTDEGDNAVNLDNGQTTKFEEDDRVNRLSKAKLVIE